MTEFVENSTGEVEKQDCEPKACWHLMEKLEQIFLVLPICVSTDSLYASKRFFEEYEKETGNIYCVLRKENFQLYSRNIRNSVSLKITNIKKQE